MTDEPLCNLIDNAVSHLLRCIKKLEKTESAIKKLNLQRAALERQKTVIIHLIHKAPYLGKTILKKSLTIHHFDVV